MAEEQEKKGKGKLIAIVAIVVVLGAGAYLFLFSGGGGGEEAATSTTLAQVEGVTIDGATMTVALGGDDGGYARVSYALVLAETADTAIVGNRVQILQDRALTAILGFEATELSTIEGIDRLRDSLTTFAHEVYPGGEVVRVVLTEVLVQ